MSSATLFRLKAAWLLGAGMVVAGVALLAAFAGLLLWQFGAFRSELVAAAAQLVDSSIAGLVPELPETWATVRHVGMGFALLGAVLGTLGVLLTRRQARWIELERRRAEDRLRRVHLYREAARKEPYIGPDADAGMENDRSRRVA